jgi:hypothetical protein
MSFKSRNDGLQYGWCATAVADTPTEARAFMVTDDTSGNAVEIKVDATATAVVLYCNKGQIYPIGGPAMQIVSTNTTADTVVFLR